MHRVFEFVLAETLAASRTWEREAGLRLDLSVNLHATALLDDDLPSFLHSCWTPWRARRSD